VTPQAIEVHVDRRRCEGHGLCIELAPELFDIDDDDVATVSQELLDERHSAAVKAAAAACPRQAVSVSSHPLLRVPKRSTTPDE
jgi:ferredoxin